MKYVKYLTEGSCLVLLVKGTGNTGSGKGLLKIELNVVALKQRWIDHVLLTVLSCFATKETVAHPSLWKQERKVMWGGSGGGVLVHIRAPAETGSQISLEDPEMCMKLFQLK